MIELNKSVLIETYVAEVFSTAGVIEEGTAMVQVLEGGKGVVRPAQGLTNEDFVGISVSRPSVPVIQNFTEIRTVPASGPYTVTAAKSLATGTRFRATLVATDGTRTTLTAGDPSATATAYSVAGNVITFNSAQAGKSVELAYQSPLSYQEAVFRYSFDVHSSAARTPIGTTGVCTVGKMLLTNYDVAADWATYSASNPIRLMAGGLLTLGGNTQAIDAMVDEIPSNTNGYLAVKLGLKHNA